MKVSDLARPVSISPPYIYSVIQPWEPRRVLIISVLDCLSITLKFDSHLVRRTYDIEPNYTEFSKLK